VLGKNLQSSIRYDLDYQKLKEGRVDLWIANRAVAIYLARKAGDRPEDEVAELVASPVPENGAPTMFAVGLGLLALAALGNTEALRPRQAVTNGACLAECLAWRADCCAVATRASATPPGAAEVVEQCAQSGRDQDASELG